jgi:4-diphosphocytidyl-2-C-methyl-D-erythritol kinase
MPSALIVRSYAKINWTLEVLFRREDGYHELRTIYQTVSLYDRLRLSKTEGSIEIVCNNSRVPCNETNLAYRAAVLLRETLGVAAGVRIEIEKRIPVAAGLGGGSSNAAAVLIGLQQLWCAQIDFRELMRIAASLGSDVPFFLIGGTALGVGRGQEVYPLEEVNAANLLLVNPGFEVATEAAYSRLSRLTRNEASLIIPFTQLAAKGIHELPLVARNDLEEVVLGAYPEIAEIKRRCIELGARHALMTGSGATVFGLFDSLSASRRALSQMRSAGLWSERVSTVNRQRYRDSIFEVST